MREPEDNDRIRNEIERTYREKRRGFLAAAGRSARNHQDAEDALQDSFARALANLAGLEAVENIPGWIFTTLRNRLADLWRRNAVRRSAGEVGVSSETLAEIAGAAGLPPEDGAVMSALSEALAEAIGALPREQRLVIEAQVLEGLSFKELSERTGVPINTLMARKRYAIKKLSLALRGWAES